eukprot:g7229.t1
MLETTEEAWKSKKRFYKQTRLCSFHQVGACKRGSSCNFAHSTSELKEMPDFSKTRMCKSFQSGHCELGAACSFAHGQHELIQGKHAKKNKHPLTEAYEVGVVPPVVTLNLIEGLRVEGSDEEAVTSTPSVSVSFGSSEDSRSQIPEAQLFQAIPDLWQRSRHDLAGNLIISC